MVFRASKWKLSPDGTICSTAFGDRISLAQSSCALCGASSQDFLASKTEKVLVNVITDQIDASEAESGEGWQFRRERSNDPQDNAALSSLRSGSHYGFSVLRKLCPCSEPGKPFGTSEVRAHRDSQCGLRSSASRYPHETSGSIEEMEPL